MVTRKKSTKRVSAGGGSGLRIVAGTVKGRRLKIPSGENVRPTQDRIRESLFNILGSDLNGQQVLDLFAGSGALGIEALSRGAAYTLFIDSRHACVQTIQDNLLKCGFQEEAGVIQGKLPGDLGKIKKNALPERYDVVFLDPPYNLWDKGELLDQLLQFNLLKEDARIVYEHYYKDIFQQVPQGFIMEEQRRYGDTVLTFFRTKDEPKGGSR